MNKFIGKLSLFKSTSSSRYVSQSFWRPLATFTTFNIEFINSLSQLSNIIFLSIQTNFKVIFPFFQNSHIFMHFFDFFQKFIFSQMINVKWFSTFSQMFSLLFSFCLSTVTTTLTITGHTLITSGHGLHSDFTAFFIFFLFTFFFFLLQTTFLLLTFSAFFFTFLTNAHLFSTFSFTFFNAVFEFFQFYIVLLTFFEMLSDESLKLLEIFLHTIFLESIEICHVELLSDVIQNNEK